MEKEIQTKTDIAEMLKNIGAKKVDYRVEIEPRGAARVVFFRVDPESAEEYEKELDAIYEHILNRVHHLTRPI